MPIHWNLQTNTYLHILLRYYRTISEKINTDQASLFIRSWKVAVDRRWFVHSRVLNAAVSVGHYTCLVWAVSKMLLRFDSSTGFSVNIKINASLVHKNSVMKFSLNDRVPISTAKMARHFPVREFWTDWKTLGKSHKILENSRNFRQMLFVIF